MSLLQSLSALLAGLILAHHFNGNPGLRTLLSLGLAQGGGFILARLTEAVSDRFNAGVARRHLAWVWLFPVVGPVGALLIGLSRLGRPTAHEPTLSYHAFLHSGTVQSLRVRIEGRRFRQEALGIEGIWRRWRARRAHLGLDGRTVQRVRAAQTKVALLLLDGLALGASAGSALLQNGLNLDDMVSPWFRALPSFLLLPAAGWLTSTIRLRRCQDRAPRLEVGVFAAYQLAAGTLLGLALGLAGAKRDVLMAWVMLHALGGLVGVGTSLGGTAVGTRAQPGTRPWFFALVSLALAAAVLPFALGPTLDRSLLAALPTLAVAVSLWWSCRVRERLLHPFLPSDTQDPSLPLAARLGVGFLKATLALPLGGLFVPFWPAVFQLLERTAGAERRRRWDRHQPLAPGGVSSR